jgi:lysophospholipase L1-like esterase
LGRACLFYSGQALPVLPYFVIDHQERPFVARYKYTGTTAAVYAALGNSTVRPGDVADLSGAPDSNWIIVPPGTAATVPYPADGMVPVWSATQGEPVYSAILRPALRASNSIVWMGDSITQNGGAVVGNTSYNGRGFWCWAQDFLGHRFRTLADAGIAGQTSAQVLARFTTDVVQLGPGWVHILAGTNDNTGTASVSATEANLTAMYDQADLAGIRVIAGTIPPRSTYTGNQRAFGEQLNDWIRDQGRRRPNFIVADYAAVLTDPATGTYYSGLSIVDGVHPSQPGAARMGQALYGAVVNFAPNYSPLSPSEGDSTNLLPKGRFSAGGAGAVPTGWADGGGGTSTYGKVARTDSLPGNWQSVTVSTAGNRYLQGTNISVDGSNLSIGDTVSAAVEYQLSGLDQAAAVNTQGFFLNLQCYNGSSFFAKVYDMYWDTSYENQPAWSRSGVLKTPPLVIPATTTLIQVVISMAGGGTYLLDRVTVRKETT